MLLTTIAYAHYVISQLICWSYCSIFIIYLLTLLIFFYLPLECGLLWTGSNFGHFVRVVANILIILGNLFRFEISKEKQELDAENPKFLVASGEEL